MERARERAWAKRGPLGTSGPGPPKCRSRPNAVYVLDERNDKFLFFQSSKICSEAGCCARLRHIPGPPVCVRDVDPLSEAGGARVPAGGRRPAPCCCARYAVDPVGNYRLIGNHRWGTGAIDNRADSDQRPRPRRLSGGPGYPAKNILSAWWGGEQRWRFPPRALLGIFAALLRLFVCEAPVVLYTMVPSCL